MPLRRRASHELPSPERLREWLAYDPETGILTWLKMKPPRGLPGKVAGAINRGYCTVSFDGHRLLAHRVIWAIQTGAWPEVEIDHRDVHGPKSGYGNRWENLREATHAENGRNHKITSRNTSGATGVHLHTQVGRWVARIHFEGREINLGIYQDFEDAVAARRAAEQRLYGEFAARIQNG